LPDQQQDSGLKQDYSINKEQDQEEHHRGDLHMDQDLEGKHQLPDEQQYPSLKKLFFCKQRAGPRGLPEGGRP
jgi:hypothetical protein